MICVRLHDCAYCDAYTVPNSANINLLCPNDQLYEPKLSNS